MALALPDKWVWDSWFIFDGTHHHVFFLHASKALHDPDRRHRHVTVGHAVSEDLTNWTRVEDAIAVSESPAFDSWTTWTGSVVRADDGKWWMFYTGTSREDGGDIQTIGAATSDDLITWTKISNQPLVKADPRWYELLDKTIWHDQAWRDPWVFRFPGESQWHMLITARANHGEPKQRGVLGHATSTNLVDWDVQPPLSEPGQGFGQLEVFQFEVVDRVPIILFCCGWRELSEDRLSKTGRVDFTYSLVVDERLTQVDFSAANAFPEPVYAARLVKNKDGWNLIGFRNIENGRFVGELSDPIPVTADPVRGLVPRE
jgi:beta-fructofuranosidase